MLIDDSRSHEAVFFHAPRKQCHHVTVLFLTLGAECQPAATISHATSIDVFTIYDAKNY